MVVRSAAHAVVRRIRLDPTRSASYPNQPPTPSASTASSASASLPPSDSNAPCSASAMAPRQSPEAPEVKRLVSWRGRKTPARFAAAGIRAGEGKEASGSPCSRRSSTPLPSRGPSSRAPDDTWYRLPRSGGGAGATLRLAREQVAGDLVLPPAPKPVARPHRTRSLLASRRRTTIAPETPPSSLNPLACFQRSICPDMTI